MSFSTPGHVSAVLRRQLFESLLDDNAANEIIELLILAGAGSLAGAGTAGRISKFTAATVVGDSTVLSENGAGVLVDNGKFISSLNGVIQIDFASGTAFKVSTDSGAFATHLLWIAPTFSILGTATINTTITNTNVKQNVGANSTTLDSLNYTVAAPGDIDLNASSPGSNIFLKADTRITNGKLFTSTDTLVSMDFGSGAYWSLTVGGSTGILIDAVSTALITHTSDTSTVTLSAGTATPMSFTLDKNIQTGNIDVNLGTLYLGRNATVIGIGDVAGAKTINIGAALDTINSVATWNHTGVLDASESIRSTAVAPTGFASGTGVELYGAGLLAYNYTGAAYTPLNYNSSAHLYYISNVLTFAYTANSNFRIGVGASDPTMNGGMFMLNAPTPPSNDVANQFSFYSADVVAGNAAPHFRTENGSIIKLFTSPAYTVTNVTTDRTYNANMTNLGELADILGTLIADLKLTGIIG